MTFFTEKSSKAIAITFTSDIYTGLSVFASALEAGFFVIVTPEKVFLGLFVIVIVFVFAIVVLLSPHHSDQMLERSKGSWVAL